MDIYNLILNILASVAVMVPSDLIRSICENSRNGRQIDAPPDDEPPSGIARKVLVWH